MDGTNTGVFGVVLGMNGTNTEGFGGVLGVTLNFVVFGASIALGVIGPGAASAEGGSHASLLEDAAGVLGPGAATAEGGCHASVLEDAAPDAVGVVGPGAGASSMRRTRFAGGADIFNSEK